MMESAGHGVSLKAAHYAELLARAVPVTWAEGVTENFLGRGGRPSAVLEHVRRDARVILHGVSMSLGGLDPFDPDYFRALRALSQRIEATFVSDHICFGSVGGHNGHDLWPLPLTEECLNHMVARVLEAQDRLGRQVVLENVSSYVQYRQSEMSEPEFIATLLQQADAGMLLDVNNVYVSAQNFGFDARKYIDVIPVERVRYLHLAGHADLGTHLLDNHGAPVCDAVWDLYEYTIARMGSIPTIVEWDSHLPTLEGLLSESARAQEHEQRALQAKPAPSPSDPDASLHMSLPSPGAPAT
ncbi:MAG: DUF692 domain-containing protein [Myxococcales bacterium]|nr:DUF692 domain-containing protein [Myxococcales bacterium]